MIIFIFSGKKLLFYRILPPIDQIPTCGVGAFSWQILRICEGSNVRVNEKRSR